MTANADTAHDAAARVEQAVQNAIMCLIAVAAGASAFTHVHDLSVSYGLPDWQGWSNAVVIELLAVTAGLELRRRRREGKTPAFAAGVLAVAVLVSLACQVAEAHPSPWGWTLSAVPALGLLAVVKLVLGRTTTPTPDPAPAEPVTVRTADHDPSPDRTAPPVQPPRPGPPVRAAAPAGPDRGPDPDQGRPDQGRGPRTARTTDLVPGPPVRTPAPAYAAAVPRTEVRAVLDRDPRLAIAERLVLKAGPDRPPTRRQLVEAIRDAGHQVGTTTAGDLLRQARARHSGGPQ
ncbi:MULTISPECIES: DUF2637 domain-containing protein [unclassified Crossiella]|uniref:DUF2637 domain-containing protein n=1 Tax=unclassified Crossiella TaxID=2620835 RepID=UPI0024940362|nr:MULTISPECIES: DUF2637 domain-containing protein [unclassified Crossiella]